MLKVGRDGEARETKNHKILLTECNSDKRYGRRKKKLFPNEKPGICQVS